MRFMAVADLHNRTINFISHNIVTVLTNVGFCRIMSSRSVGPPTPIRGVRYSVRMCKSPFNISSSPTSSRHLSRNLCLYNELF